MSYPELLIQLNKSTIEASCCPSPQDDQLEQKQHETGKQKPELVTVDSINSFDSLDEIDVPLFNRKDFVLGECLCKGSFSKVYDITRITGKNLNIFSHHPVSSSTHVKPSYCTSTEDIISSSSVNALNNLEISSSKSSDSANSRSLSGFLLKKPKSSKKKKFAMKMLRQSTLQKSEKYCCEAAKRILNELQLLSLFNHDNITNVYGFSRGSFHTSPGTTSPTSFNEMFLIIGQLDGTLDDQLFHWKHQHDFDNAKIQNKSDDKKNAHESYSKGKLLVDKHLRVKVDLALQIADVLQYIHKIGFIYRDLKPHNIGLVVKKRRDPMTQKRKDYLHVILFDFSLCRKLPKPVPGKSEDAINTLYQFYEISAVGACQRYMAPEIINKELYNPKVDVYSCGLVFYTMLTLCKPYEGYSNKQHKTLVCQNGIRPAFHASYTGTTFQVPRLLQKIIQTSWNQKASERPTMQALFDDIRRWSRNHGYSSNTYEESSNMLSR